jgi:hypothetical protein
MRRPRHHTRIASRLATKSLVGSDGLGFYGYGRPSWAGAAPYDLRRHSDLSANSVVSIGLSWIRRNVTKGRFCVGNLQPDGTYKEVPNHPIYELFRRPNPFDTWEATLGGTSDSLKLKGNAYWIIAKNQLEEAKEVYWFPNHQITPEPETDPDLQRERGPVRQYWLSAGGRRRSYPPERVIHFKDGIDPNARWMGMCDLQRQIANAASIDFAQRYTTAVLRNAHGGKVLAPKEQVGEVLDGSPEALQMGALARRLEDGISGENAGRVIETSLPVDLLDAGLGPEQMQLDRITHRPEAYLLAALGLNSLVLALPSSVDQSTYANKGEARRDAWENGVIPVQDLIAAGVQLLLWWYFTEYGADTCWVDRRDIEALREDRTARAGRAITLYGGPIATLNEARGEYDLKPVQGGDATPIDEAAAQAEQAQAIAEAQAQQQDQPTTSNDVGSLN